MLKDPAALARAVAGLLAGEARRSMALCGGATVRLLFSLLAEERLRWPELHVFWGDERYVPHDHPESNYGLARALFLSKVGMPPGNVHPIPTGAGSPEEDARAYEGLLRGHFTARTFDVVLLGLGNDGHTASLFPGSPALRDPRWAAPAFSPKGIRQRITLTPAALNASAHAVFMAAGTAKAGVVREALCGGLPPELAPAKLIRPTAGRRTFFLDEAAASLL